MSRRLPGQQSTCGTLLLLYWYIRNRAKREVWHSKEKKHSRDLHGHKRTGSFAIGANSKGNRVEIFYIDSNSKYLYCKIDYKSHDTVFSLTGADSISGDTPAPFFRNEPALGSFFCWSIGKRIYMRKIVSR